LTKNFHTLPFFPICPLALLRVVRTHPQQPVGCLFLFGAVDFFIFPGLPCRRWTSFDGRRPRILWFVSPPSFLSDSALLYAPEAFFRFPSPPLCFFSPCVSDLLPTASSVPTTDLFPPLWAPPFPPCVFLMLHAFLAKWRTFVPRPFGLGCCLAVFFVRLAFFFPTSRHSPNLTDQTRPFSFFFFLPFRTFCFRSAVPPLLFLLFSMTSPRVEAGFLFGSSPVFFLPATQNKKQFCLRCRCVSPPPPPVSFYLRADDLQNCSLLPSLHSAPSSFFLFVFLVPFLCAASALPSTVFCGYWPPFFFLFWAPVIFFGVSSWNWVSLAIAFFLLLVALFPRHELREWLFYDRLFSPVYRTLFGGFSV